MDDDDGFIKVMRKKKSSTRPSHQIPKNNNNNIDPREKSRLANKSDNDRDDSKCQIERVLKEIFRMRETLETSEFLKSLKLAISKVEHELDAKLVEIVSYGIGNVSSCKLSMHQFVLMQILADHLQIPSVNCHLYDPCFTTSDLDLLTHWNFDIIQQNEECRRSISMPTLFYMPHCGRPMYNNVLSSNWTRWRMSRVCILGNSFQSIVNNTLKSDLSTHYPCIEKIFPCIKEFHIENSFVYPDVFNNLSLHLFDKKSLKNHQVTIINSGDDDDHGGDDDDIGDSSDDGDGFWLCPADVTYDCNEEIIIRTV